MNAEIGQQRAVAVHENVVRLDVTMDDALLVRGVQRRQHLLCHLQHPSHRPGRWLDLQAVFERPAAHEQHHQVQQPVVFARVVHGQDVGVLQVGDGLNLAVEALDKVGLVRQGRIEHLDRYSTPQAQMLRLIDGAHPTTAE